MGKFRDNVKNILMNISPSYKVSSDVRNSLLHLSSEIFELKEQINTTNRTASVFKNKIAFVCPTFPPHYEYACNMLESFYKYRFNEQADMWFVFSNEEDRKLFPEAVNGIVTPPTWIILLEIKG